MTALAMSSCSMKQDGPSRVVINIPASSALKSSSKISAMSYDWDNACFMVSVKGEGIVSVPPANSCGVETGLFGGPVPPGGTMTLNVPRGGGFSLDVFVYFRSSSTSACPAVTSLAAVDPTRTVRVGQTTFDAHESTVDVGVSVAMPSSSTNLITQYGLAPTCSTASFVPGTGSSAIVAGRGTQSGGSFVAQSTVSGRQSEKVLQGGSFRLQLTRRPNGE